MLENNPAAGFSSVNRRFEDNGNEGLLENSPTTGFVWS